jgi:hypothetical protein
VGNSMLSSSSSSRAIESTGRASPSSTSSSCPATRSLPLACSPSTGDGSLGLVVGANTLLNARRASRGVSLCCCLPLRRLSFPGVSAAARRSSTSLNAARVCGVGKLGFRVDGCCTTPPGVLSWAAAGVRLVDLRVEGGPVLEPRRRGVLGFGIIFAS